ncbi:hypothetical protein GCM10009425_38080 [Pseudomonas asuensis]|uniref:DUF3987 domain-containing protein n=2 Tax=Pseudomonas asuensis TaxID=1825787 RepID=A0ABQ2H0J0_9PSED|nr:hypothetical protein GCM10009425_38080 [Pseudomonas asuensis]
MEDTNEKQVESSRTVKPDYADGWPRFHEHSLIEAAVREAVRELQVSYEMAYMCALGSISTACQGRIDVEMPTRNKVPASLMLLTIAESGERKTATQNYFFAGIHALNNEAHRAHKAALSEHRIQHQIWTIRKRLLERIYNKSAVGEDERATRIAHEALEEHVRSEPQPATSGAFLYEDTTPQALVQMLDVNNPNGCLLTSEASSIFSGKALGELDKLNTLWDGGTVNVDRVSRGNINLEGARLTLSLMAQPSVIAKFMAKRGEEARGTGFLARFLVVKPRSMAGQRVHVSGQQHTQFRQQKFNARILECMKLTVSSSERQVLRFSEPAADFWYECSQYLEQEMQENGLYYYAKDHASKLLENVTRLSAILHAFERSSELDKDIDRATLEFAWNFALVCSKHFIENLAGEPQLVTDANNLAHFLIRLLPPGESRPAIQRRSNSLQPSSLYESLPNNLVKGEMVSFTLTDVKQKGPSGLRGRANAERLDAAIKLLNKLGHVEKVRSQYKFCETILLERGEPRLKNGEILTIKELPLFTEQVYWSPKRAHGLVDGGGYYFKVK